MSDWTPVGTQPSQSANDWKPVGQPTESNFHPTNYDPIVQEAASERHIDPRLLKAVGEQETGMGTSPLYDPKTGLSRTPGNAGHGIWQLDPASGASPADLARAARDPRFAAQRAAAMIAENLAKYGTVRKALAAYNAGNPESPVGLKYADEVLGRMNTIKPFAIAKVAPKPEPPSHPHIAEAGISPQGLIKGVEDAYKFLNHQKVEGVKTMDWMRTNPIQSLGNALSTLQRPTVMLAADLANGNWTNPQKVLGDMWHAVTTPADNQKIVDAFETAIIHDFGFQGKAEDLHGIGKFIADLAVETAGDPLTYIPVADIFSVGSRVFKLVAAASHSKAALETAAKAMGPLAKNPAFGKLLSHLQAWHDSAGKMSQQVSHVVKKLGERRPELEEAGFTHQGKLARMGIESAQTYHATRRAADNAEILHRFQSELKGLKYGDKVPPAVQRHLLMEAWKFGDSEARSEAETMLKALGMPPTAQELKAFPKPLGYIHYEGPLQENYVSKIIPKGPHAKTLDEHTKAAIEFLKAHGSKVKMPFVKPVTEKIDPKLQDFSMYDLIRHRMTIGNEVVRRQAIAHNTANLYRQYGDKVLSHVPNASDEVLPEWFARNVPDRSSQFVLGNELANKAVRRISDAFKVGILGNPLPHGLVNVGTVTLFRSNPYVMGRGIAYALRGIPKSLDERLENIGGKTSYWKDPSTIPFLIPEAYKQSQNVLDRLETAYRASYLQYLDKTEGVLAKDDPNFLLHELQKGQKVNLDIGDYHNPTQFAAWFKALGGLYDVFRLDVVPRAGLHALKGKTGTTIGLATRAQQNFNQQFMPPGEEIEGGALSDFAKILNPLGAFDYMTSPATVGPVIGGIANQLKHEGEHYVTSLGQDLQWIGNYIFPMFGSSMKIKPSSKDLKSVGIDPKNFPAWLKDDYNQAPYWVKFWIEAGLGYYTKHEPSWRTVRRDEATYRHAEQN